MARFPALAASVAGCCLLAGCAAEDGPARGTSTVATPGERSGTTSSPPAGPSASPSPSPSAPWRRAGQAVRPADPDDVRVRTALTAVHHLAGRVGPRHGTSPAYRRAAEWVERRLVEFGWQVRRQPFRTPAGVSWGVPVPAGQSVNLVATRGDVRPGRPWLVVGAHLDTVPQAPGAEDNASGIGVLLAVAQAVRETRTRLPVTLVAFGSEEPRGPGDDDHHFGSRAFVARLPQAGRRSLRGMVSLDRVGVGAVVPVSSANGPDAMRARLLAAARRADVPTVARTGNRASDHWSFVRAGLPGVRLGSTPYAGYHSPGDVPSVVEPAQLRRSARIVVSWLAPR